MLPTPFSYLGTLLRIPAPSFEYLVAVGIFGAASAMMMGGIGSVSFSPLLTMYWETIPAEKMRR